MGQTIYHKLSAEVTGPDGRLWVVSVEPPFTANAEKVHYDCTIQQFRDYSEHELSGGKVESEPLTYHISGDNGIFAALSQALDLVPR